METIFEDSGMIALGFSFGMSVWAICAGISWSIKIVKIFASGAT